MTCLHLKTAWVAENKKSKNVYLECQDVCGKFLRQDKRQNIERDHKTIFNYSTKTKKLT